MSYSSNPLLPKARIWAVNLVLVEHLPLNQAARRAAIHRTTLWRWLRRYRELGLDNRNKYLPTRSSRPHRPGHCLLPAVVARIIYYRRTFGRCAEVIHAYCIREGTKVSLSSVKRVLRRLGFVVPTRWKRYRPGIPRPAAVAPGSLVQTDTVHLTSSWRSKQRTYLYTAIDVYSRWAYAEYQPHISQELSVQFLARAEAYAGFHFHCVQADNGPEYGKHFEVSMAARGTLIRHSRVRRPNDNAFVERFNRTIQEECVGTTDPFSEELYGKVLKYLAYYNDERLHLGIQCRTPLEMLQRY